MLTSECGFLFPLIRYVVRVGDVDETTCGRNARLDLGDFISGAFFLLSSSEKLCTKTPLERAHVGHEGAGAGPSTACCVPLCDEPIVSSLVRAVDEQSEDDATDDQRGY